MKKTNDIQYTKETFSYGPIGNEIEVFVLIPNCEGTFKCAYMFHGTGSCDAWFITNEQKGVNIQNNVQDWTNKGLMEPMLLIFPRIVKPASMKSSADPFYIFKINELKSIIEEKYAKYLKFGRENTAVAGYSMGGAAALLYVSRFPDMFKYVGAISPGPVVTSGGWADVFKNAVNKFQLPIELFIGGGGGERQEFKDTITDVEKILSNKKDIVTISSEIIPNVEHDFTAFNPLIKTFLTTTI